MKEYKICCDHCGKELDTMYDFDDIQIDIVDHKCTITTDLCEECLDKLYNLVYDFCEGKNSE